MVGFGLFLFPRSQKYRRAIKQDPKSDQNAHIFHFGGIGFAFWGLLFGVWNRTLIMLARTTHNCPRRMNTSPEQETSIIYVTYVRTKGHAATRRHYDLSLTKGRALWRGHKPTRGRGEGWQSNAAEGWQGTDATSMTPPFALSTTAAC